MWFSGWDNRMCLEMDEIYNEGAKRGRDEGIAQGIDRQEM